VTSRFVVKSAEYGCQSQGPAVSADFCVPDWLQRILRAVRNEASEGRQSSDFSGSHMFNQGIDIPRSP